MPAPPLTHHDILALVEPFARRGRHVDLAASQRQERRLVFKPPVGAGAASASSAAPHETLRLDCLDSGSYRLTRTLECADGLQGILQAQGSDLAALLADVEAVPAERHFATGPGFAIARSYTLDRASAGSTASLTLTHGSVRVDGLMLTLSVPAFRRLAGEIRLEPASNQKLALPEDMLAVLGWNWARLVPGSQGWTSKLRLRGHPLRRTRDAETALDRAAAHLAQTLAEPPARYHERLRAARWGVFFRRGIPTLTILSLLLAVTLIAWFRPDVSPTTLVAIHHVPTLIIAVSFIMQELARFEIPPWPRRLQLPAWHQAPQPVAGSTVPAGAAP